MHHCRLSGLQLPSYRNALTSDQSALLVQSARPRTISSLPCSICPVYASDTVSIPVLCRVCVTSSACGITRGTAECNSCWLSLVRTVSHGTTTIYSSCSPVCREVYNAGRGIARLLVPLKRTDRVNPGENKH